MSGSQRRGGMIQLQVGGVMQDCMGDFSYNLGVPLREDVEGSTGLLGYSEKAQPAFIEGAIGDRADLDVKALLATEGATVTLIAGNGKVIMLRDAWQSNAGNVATADGKIEVKFTSRHQGEEV